MTGMTAFIDDKQQSTGKEATINLTTPQDATEIAAAREVEQYPL